jgi:hypothetical protein
MELNIKLIQENPSAFSQVMTSAICSYIDLERKLEEWVKDVVTNGFPISEKPVISNRFEYFKQLEKVFDDAIWAYEQHIFINKIINKTNQNDILTKLLEQTKSFDIEKVFLYYQPTYFWTDEEKEESNKQCNEIANKIILELLEEEKIKNKK